MSTFNPLFSLLGADQASMINALAPKRAAKVQKLQARLDSGNLNRRQTANVQAKINKNQSAISNKVFNSNNPATLGFLQELANKRQSEENFKTNNPNETNAYGSVNYSRDPVTGEVTRNETLNPAEQKRLDAERGRDEMYDQGIKSAMDQYNNAPALTNDFSADRQRIEDELYNRFKTRADERFRKEQNDLEQSMLQRGIPIGQRAYNSSMDNFTKGKTDAYQAASFDAVRAGGQEQQNLWNMLLQRRNQPLNEISTFNSNMSGVKNPMFQQFRGSEYNAPDYASIGTNFSNFKNQAEMNAAGNKTSIDIANINKSGQLEAARIAAASRNSGGGGSEGDMTMGDLLSLIQAGGNQKSGGQLF
jgi:hypothetical protein